jgi:signal peptidase
MLQKSRNITILMLAILATYSIIANYSLVGYGFRYYFIVNPLFWIIFIVAIFICTSKKNEGVKLKENIFTYSLIAALVNIGVYIFSEVFIEIGKNPYSMSLKGILMNAYIFFLPIVAKEYTRFRVINNVYEKDKKYIAVVATIIYAISDISMNDLADSSNVMKFIFADIIPIISTNVICTYIAMNQFYKPAICYRVITFSYWILAPILPKVPWIMKSVIDTIIPVILFIYIRYLKNKNDVQKKKKTIESTDPKSIILLVVVVVLILWFDMGLFPIRPSAIATGSMEKTLMVGDVAILKKCTAEELEVGDIVQYQKENFTVIHRVISKYTEKGKIYFITKGDNNKDADFEPVEESQIIAKEIFSIRYLGLPAVFLNNLNKISVPDTSSIEKGM